MVVVASGRVGCGVGSRQGEGPINVLEHIVRVIT